MSLIPRGWSGFSALVLGVFGAALAGGITAGACALPGYSLGESGATGAGGAGGGATTDGAGGKLTTSASVGAGGAGGDAPGVGGSGGSPTKMCSTADDCGPAKPCQAFTCNEGVCKMGPGADGELGDDPTLNPPGDCNVAMCEGGHLKYVAQPADKPKDDKDCTNDECSGPYIDHTLPASNTCIADPSNQTTGTCLPNGDCIECTQPNGQINCPICIEGQCGIDSCGNQIKDPNETGTDCGGKCPACPKGSDCISNNDCLTGVCTGGVCQKESCIDGVRNGAEAGPDCGKNSGCGKACVVGDSCNGPDDCATGLCKKGVCQFTCGDGMTTGHETDIDCGGPHCPPCLP